MDMSILAKAFFDIPEAASLPLPGDGGGFPALITGLSGVHRAQLAAALGLRTGRSVLLLTPDEAAAEALAGDLAAFTGERPTLLTGREFVFISADASPARRSSAASAPCASCSAAPDIQL